MKLYLFLRSLIWTSILSVSAAIASVVSAFIQPESQVAIPLGLASVALAVLSPRATR